MIHNVLLEEAKKQYRAEKYEMMAKELESKIEEVTSDDHVTAPVSPSSSFSSTSETSHETNLNEKEKDK